ncbi:hypothetical protein SEEE5646_26026, partial [Salmonella enterica subsp. enterica serovar Enteritidis str. 50-5646]
SGLSVTVIRSGTESHHQRTEHRVLRARLHKVPGDVFRDIKFKNIHIQLPGKPAQRFPCYHHMMVPPVKMHLCLMHFRQDNTVLSATK